MVMGRDPAAGSASIAPARRSRLKAKRPTGADDRIDHRIARPCVDALHGEADVHRVAMKDGGEGARSYHR
jgi:hypothetical protein